jgi:hypothetical protein
MDIANACVWLASDAAKFIHGAVLSIDGGLCTRDVMHENTIARHGRGRSASYCEMAC